MLAGAGYYSAANIEAVAANDIVAFICDARERHNPALIKRTEEPPVQADFDGPIDGMRHRMRTPAGKTLYALRKCTIEPTFGLIKHVMSFRQFLLRGLKAVTGEWNLVCIAFDLKKLRTLTG